MSVEELVRQSIATALDRRCHPIRDEDHLRSLVEDEINNMSNLQLLQLISTAIEEKFLP